MSNVKMPHPLALPTALLFLGSGTILSLYTFISPIAAARIYGIDLQQSTGNPPDADYRFVPVFGGRNLALGLATFAFYWQGMPRAMGTLLLCLTVTGMVDIVVTSLWGMKDKAWTHAAGTVIVGLAGWGMLV